ncbi:MAG TPA: putative Ig domain-containing protein [Candidatus Eisenbacteria bacterium]|nr:putative Ig domain-containing protein [Candidatus Eisenbacteria bacterium]
MKVALRLLAVAALACFWSAPAMAQYMYMDTNGDGVWSTADVLNPNGTPTSVDVYLNTTHNRDGSVATCDSQDGNLAIWNSFATHISVPGGTVTFSNYTNQQAAFTINCSNGGLAFTSTSTEAAQCQATGTPIDNGGATLKLYTMTVTGVSGTPSLQFVPLNSLDNNPTSFGTNCGGLDFDNTYKLGTDWFDVNGAGPAPGGNALPILSVATTANGTEGQPFTITATATDTDGADVLTITATGYPSSLTLTTTPATHTATATLSGTLGLDDQGDHTITWSVSDGTNPPVTATTLLTVANLDQAPVVTAPANVSGAVGTPITVTVTANDPDGDIIANLTAAPLPVGAEFTANTGNTAGTLTWTPVAGQEGATNVIFTASNSLFGSATTVFTISGSGADVPPTVTAPTSVIGSEGTLVTFTVTASDPDGDPITSLTGSPLPTGATFTANAANTMGTFNWTPTFEQSGTYTVTWTASNALTGTASTAITIENTDQPPVLAPIGDVTVAEGSSATVNVVATDVDGDLITLDTTLPTFAVLNAPTSGTGTVSTTITLSPTTGSAGSYTGTVRATSGSFTDSTTFTITVTGGGADQAPIVTAPATMSGEEGTLVTFTVSASDPDGQAIASLTAAPLPTGATFTANAAKTSGTFDWTPASGQAGTYDVTFTASNALTGSATTHLTITAPTVDQAPVVTAPANESGTEGTLLTFTVTASDPDGQPITSLAATPLPTGATFTASALNTSGTFSWTPASGQAGTYDVTFTAANALSGSAATHITITAPGVDHAPVVTAPANESGTEGTLLTFTVTANDPDGDVITSLTAAPLPTGATFTANASNTSGTFNWTPSATQSGVYTVTFTAQNALSGSASTEITVNNVDAAPVVTAPTTQSGGEGTTITFTVTASDPDGDAITSLTAAGTAITAGATFTANASNTSGTFEWTNAGPAGSYSVTFTASNALSSSATTAVNVTGVNHEPVVTAPATASGDEGTLITFTVSATDADGDHVTLTMLGGPSGATFSDNGDNTGTFSWTPGFNQAGVYTVNFQGSDGNGATGSASTVITVNDVNRAPTADAGGPYTGVINVAVSFDGSGSSDPDGDTLTYAWDFGDGGTGSGVNPSHTYTAGGTYTVTLTVTDPGMLSSTATTTATISTTLSANAFTVGGNKTTSLGAGKPYTCVQVEAVDGSFQNTDVDISSIKMVSNGTGSVSEIFADPSKSSVDGDKNGNGVQEIVACFKKSDLRLLFSNLAAGRQTVNVTIEGSLVSGATFSAPLTMIVKSTGAVLVASVSPNPLNPQAKLTFATSKPGAVRVQMFDPQGRLVKTIADERAAMAGYHDYTIDGRSSTGAKLASGVYFVKIVSEADGSTVTRVTIMK